jgi:hypothetical protein
MYIMWPNVRTGAFSRLLTCSLFVGCLLSAVQATASSGLLNGALGRWLDTRTGPQLGELLGKHPKFKGETIHLVSMENGKPVEVVSRLHQAIQDHLKQRLLKYPGVRLAWNEPEQRCGAPRTVPYLLGIEIERTGSYSHSLNIAMVDVAESVWVSGVNYTWQGRLTGVEKLALNTSVNLPPKGTVESPLPASATSEITQLLQRNVKCTLPEGLDGPVFLEPSNSRVLSRIRGQLQRDLSLAALAAMTHDPEDAEWKMSLTANPVGSQTQEVVLTLTDRNNELTQHLASVFVVGLALDTGKPHNAPGPEVRLAGINPGALSPLSLNTTATGGICETHNRRPDYCVEVTFELTRVAYLFVLSTRERNLHANTCSSLVKRSNPGERRFRLRVPRGERGGTADAGLYAIAVHEKALARKLARHIQHAPGTCTRHSKRGLDTWLAELDRMLADHPTSFEWRAMHLATGPTGVIRI